VASGRRNRGRGGRKGDSGWGACEAGEGVILLLSLTLLRLVTTNLYREFLRRGSD